MKGKWRAVNSRAMEPRSEHALLNAYATHLTSTLRDLAAAPEAIGPHRRQNDGAIPV